MSTAETDALAAQVRHLLECQPATNILHSFAAALDEPQVDAVMRLFREDAVLVSPRRSCHGQEEIRSCLFEAWAADPSEKRHCIASPRVTLLDAARVRLETYFHFVGRLPESSIIGWGTYDAVVDVGGPEPRFARLEVESHLRTDLERGWATRHAAAAG